MSLAEEFGVRAQTAFTIRIIDGHERRVIQPRGELDIATRDQLHAALIAAFESGARTIVLDLSRLEFMDSTGVQLACMATRIAEERRREFLLVRGPRHIQRPFDLAGITDRLSFSD